MGEHCSHSHSVLGYTTAAMGGRLAVRHVMMARWVALSHRTFNRVCPKMASHKCQPRHARAALSVTTTHVGGVFLLRLEPYLPAGADDQPPESLVRHVNRCLMSLRSPLEPSSPTELRIPCLTMASIAHVFGTEGRLCKSGSGPSRDSRGVPSQRNPGSMRQSRFLWRVRAHGLLFMLRLSPAACHGTEASRMGTQ